MRIEARAPSFLYHQVRRLVGTLVAVGKGALRPADVAQLLRTRDGRLCPTMAPAHGLYLADVSYDDQATQPDDDAEQDGESSAHEAEHAAPPAQ